MAKFSKSQGSANSLSKIATSFKNLTHARSEIGETSSITLKNS